MYKILGGYNEYTILHHEEQQKCTFIHECLHGIDEIVEAKLTEDQVRLVSKGLYDFIKTNPDVFEEELKESIMNSKKLVVMKKSRIAN